MAGITLTRRGRGVLALCVLAVVMALLFGSRSLNAVVVPGAIALVAGYYQLSRLDPPGLRRVAPPDDFVATEHEVGLSFTDPESGGGSFGVAFLASVRDQLGSGLVRTDVPARTTVGTRATSYTVNYVARGERRFGPVLVDATDVLGLFERRFDIRASDSVLVYPRRRPIPAQFRHALYSDDALGPSRQREQFDRLREYARGDALRDIHWSATAKQEDLIVKEFAAESEHRRVTIAGGASSDVSDSLAEAITSISLALLDDGIPVEVIVPDGSIQARPSRGDRRQLLELLAQTPAGAVPDRDADVVVDAGQRDTTVQTESVSYRFADLVDAATSERDTTRTAAPAPQGTDDSAESATVTDGGSEPAGQGQRRDQSQHLTTDGRGGADE